MYKQIKLTCKFSEFRKILTKYLEILGGHYGGVMTPATMVIYLKPCPKDIIIYNGEFYVTSSQTEKCEEPKKE